MSVSCSPKCPYFPRVENVEYVIDKDGVKKTTYKFVCGYDSCIISSWNKKCPREKVKR